MRQTALANSRSTNLVATCANVILNRMKYLVTSGYMAREGPGRGEDERTEMTRKGKGRKGRGRNNNNSIRNSIRPNQDRRRRKIFIGVEFRMKIQLVEEVLKNNRDGLLPSARTD